MLRRVTYINYVLGLPPPQLTSDPRFRPPAPGPEVGYANLPPNLQGKQLLEWLITHGTSTGTHPTDARRYIDDARKLFGPAKVKRFLAKELEQDRIRLKRGVIG